MVFYDNYIRFVMRRFIGGGEIVKPSTPNKLGSGYPGAIAKWNLCSMQATIKKRKFFARISPGHLL